MRDLSTLEQSLIIAALVDQPKRPGRFSLGWFQQQIDIGVYSDNDVKAALDAMCLDKILYRDGDDYFMQRTQYLELRKRFRWPLRRNSAVRKQRSLWGFLWKHFIITILVSLVTAVLTVCALRWLGLKQ